MKRTGGGGTIEGDSNQKLPPITYTINTPGPTKIGKLFKAFQELYSSFIKVIKICLFKMMTFVVAAIRTRDHYLYK